MYQSEAKANGIVLVVLALMCLCICTSCMRGEYDSRLVLPFRGDVTIHATSAALNIEQLYKIIDVYEDTVRFNNATVAFGSADRVIVEEKAAKGWGCPQFITHTNKVESSTTTRRYIVNDCLTFRVTKLIVHSV